MKLNRLSILLSFFILGCTTTAEIEGLPEMDKETTIKFNQYYRDGRLLYVNYCSSCHMESGEGLNPRPEDEGKMTEKTNCTTEATGRKELRNVL